MITPLRATSFCPPAVIALINRETGTARSKRERRLTRNARIDKAIRISPGRAARNTNPSAQLGRPPKLLRTPWKRLVYSTTRNIPPILVRWGGCRLHLLDLPILQFQWGGPAENGGDDPDHSLVGDDLLDLALEVLEGPVGDLDLVALLKLDVELGVVLGLLRLFQHLGLVTGDIGVGLPLEPMKSPTPSVSLIMNQTF